MERIKKGKMTVVQVLFFVHSYIRLYFQFMRTGFMNKTNQIDNYLTSSFWKDGECLKESDRHEMWHVRLLHLPCDSQPMPDQLQDLNWKPAEKKDPDCMCLTVLIT